jgi:predicted small metal-binding protein
MASERQGFDKARLLVYASKGDPTMAKKTVKCPCGWTYSTENEDDLIREVQKHGKEVHDMNPSREEVLAMAQPE